MAVASSAFCGSTRNTGKPAQQGRRHCGSCDQSRGATPYRLARANPALASQWHSVAILQHDLVASILGDPLLVCSALPGGGPASDNGRMVPPEPNEALALPR